MSTTHTLAHRRRGALGSTLLLAVLLALAATPALAQTSTPPAAGVTQESAAVTPPPAATPQPPPAGEKNVAPAVLVPSETRLVFQGSVGETLVRTFALKAVGGPVSALRIGAGDLLETVSDRAILSTQISVNPAQVAALNDVQTIAVTVAPGAARSGVYTGTLSIWYASTPLTSTTPLTTPLTIELHVTLDAVPNVAADANSVNQTLFAQTTDLPFVGAPISRTEPVLGELPIILLASTRDSAPVTAAEVLSVRNSDGLTLPSGVVRVQTSLPLTIPGQGAATLPLVLGGKNLPAGSYAGNVRIQVANQPTVVLVPFTVKLKDNWLWAMAVLAASLVVGVLIAWYNNGGASALQTIREINRQNKALQENQGHLQKAEWASASKLLKATMDALRSGADQNMVEARSKAFADYIQAQSTAIDELRKQVHTVREQVDAVTGAPNIRDSLGKRLEALLHEIDQGQLASLAEGKRLLQALQDELAALGELQKLIAALAPKDRDAINLATAGSIGELGERLRKLQIERIDDLIAESGRVEMGIKVRDGLVEQLHGVRKSLAAADQSALGQFSPRVNELEAQVKTLVSYQATWIDAGRPGGPALDALNTAATLDALRQEMDKQRPKTPTLPTDAGQAFGQVAGGGGSYALPGAVQALANPIDSLFDALARLAPGERSDAAEQAWTAYTFKMQFGGLATKLLLALFALLVGWAALYLSNQTFGARPEDYIALFLWGATVNGIAGQQVKLENIYGHKTVDLKLAVGADPTPPANAGGGQAGGGAPPPAQQQ